MGLLKVLAALDEKGLDIFSEDALMRARLCLRASVLWVCVYELMFIVLRVACSCWSLVRLCLVRSSARSELEGEDRLNIVRRYDKNARST